MESILETLREALLGRYEVERELGAGGMALVFAARDVRLGRAVAIKVLRPDLTQTVGAERFQREIVIEARLRHPNILGLFESGAARDLLYYVMPLVEGESLADRLRRERQLAVDETIAIAKQVAAALDHAHEHGVLHRDVKPANILLSNGHAWVADFGIARAMHAAGGEWQTEDGTSVWHSDTGVVMGTIGYMSPEQAMGAEHLDGRTDQYALACLVYESLAGETPFTGRDLSVYVSKMLALDPPSVMVVRDKVPRRLDEALRRALSKTPADRFLSCTEFATALEEARDRGPSFWDGLGEALKSRAAVIAAAGALVVLGAVAIPRVVDPPPPPTPPDTTRYVVFPFDVAAGAELAIGGERQLRDALGRWTGLTIVDPFQLDEALAGHQSLTHVRAADVARKLNAGRHIRTSVAPVGDSLRVHATLYEAPIRGPPRTLSDHSVRLARTLNGTDAAFVALTDRLLFRGLRLTSAPSPTETRSLPAAQAWASGQEAIDEWDLDAAASTFAAAATFDPEYARAYLWTAVARSWGGGEATRWRIPAEQASIRRRLLSPRDQALADAVLAHVRGDLGRACPLWKAVTEAHPSDYSGWYGWARCQASDSAVVPDRRSPSRWSFRTSYHRMLGAYERAFELHPAILGTRRAASYDSLHALFFTRSNALRSGKAIPPDSMAFLAYPTWEGDSLAFVPFPTGVTAPFFPSPQSFDEAIRRQRLRFRRVAETWMAAYPTSVGAVEALAASLAILGDAAAIDTLRRGRRLVRDPREAFSLAVEEVWMQFAFGLPFQEPRIHRARALADSLLDRHPPEATPDPRLTAALAALTGRALLAAAYMRDPSVGDRLGIPPPLRPHAAALLSFAALGGPEDSLQVLEREVATRLEMSVAPSDRVAAHFVWLLRPATLAFSTYRFSVISAKAAGQWHHWHLPEVQWAWTVEDTLAVRRGLARIRDERRPLSREVVTMDVLYPEAELLAALGDSRAAAEWLDPALAVLPRKFPQEFADPVRVASIVRAVALRARLDVRLGNREGATAWAAAITTLWSDADPFLQAIVQELRELSGQHR